MGAVIQLTTDNDDVLLPVKVVPNASRDRIAGELDGALKINVSAAPERGAANKAVCKLLARTLGLRANRVTIDAGPTTARKTIRISGVTAEAVRAALGGS
jgi:hypothetical protein